jgi:uncharacterized membrane protein
MYHHTMCVRRMSAWLLALVLLAACGDDGDGAIDAQHINGCPTLTAPQANPGDPIDGDTLATFAQPLFDQFCTRCHASTLTGDDRSGAPVGFDWDVEASIRAELPRIRNAVGVFNFMPFNAPLLSCEQRQRLVRWIDAGAP